MNIPVAGYRQSCEMETVFRCMEILGAAGIKLRSTEQDFLYRQFLLNAENLTVSRCEDILKQHNEKPLFRGEQR